METLMAKKIETVEKGYEKGIYIPKFKRKYKLYDASYRTLISWKEEKEKLKNIIDKRLWAINATYINAGLCFVNSSIIKNDVFSGVLLFSSSFLIAYVLRTVQLMLKNNTFTTAIFEYDNLKMYEDMFPGEKKITNNVKLKGVSSRKINKRAKKADKVKTAYKNYKLSNYKLSNYF